MGILITPNTETIKIKGTDIELNSVYARIEFTAHPDGSTISVTFKTYKDQSFFLIGEELFTTINAKTFDFAILETEKQSIETALNYMSQRFTELGYSATIIP